MIFWVEVSREIGMGHLMESLALAESFRSREISCHFIVNSYPPAEKLLFSKNISFDILPIDQAEKVCQRIKQYPNNTCVIVNHRNVELSSLKRLQKELLIVVVIDQLGNKRIACDLLINSSIVPEWLKYTIESRKPKCLFGADFAILREEFIELHKKEKTFPDTNRKVLVTMGGIDRTGATLRIMEALKQLDRTVNSEIILGGGFAHLTEFKRIFKRLNEHTCTYAQGVVDLAARMQKADVVISAGGNTVYEMACVGIPGIVLWEDPHEDRVGQAFAEKGIVLHLGKGINIPVSKICDGIERLLNCNEKRIEMSQCGKKLVDGQGAGRIFTAIVNLIQK
ncbi:MAG: UDP-2,4-diacetamido-2,4,6-trideoxy-beta-L-altropyranose hydrolase [Planctomycetes bacterium]|nr:UDP-2,4-diacetamido-2,4,6-trideoxy-beta-L-altropyranose hydrolase [Planctomycetota bacterium]